MPCTDGGVPYPPTRYEVLTSMVPAMLCAVLTALGQEKAIEVIQAIDEKEAGVTQHEVFEWWDLHVKRDRVRKQYEKAKAATARNARAALKAMTPAQRVALGYPADFKDC